MNMFKHFIRTIFNERGDFGRSKDKEEGEQGIIKAGAQSYERGKMTPEEESQYKKSFSIGDQLQQLYNYYLGLGKAPEGTLTGEQMYQQGGPLAQGVYNATLTGVQNPYAEYESTLQPQLQAAEDYINRNAQQRGLLRSGIPIEQMGRAGVELAIQEANNRMNWRQQQLQQGAALSEYGQNLRTQNLTNLGNLYGQQQQFGLNAMGRQAGQAQAAAQYQAYPYVSQLSNYYSNQGMLGRGIGTVGGALVGGAMGGPTGAMVGAGAGGALGSYF